MLLIKKNSLQLEKVSMDFPGGTVACQCRPVQSWTCLRSYGAQSNYFMHPVTTEPELRACRLNNY